MGLTSLSARKFFCSSTLTSFPLDIIGQEWVTWQVLAAEEVRTFNMASSTFCIGDRRRGSTLGTAVE